MFNPLFVFLTYNSIISFVELEFTFNKQATQYTIKNNAKSQPDFGAAT
jgi:hypothetical protein